MLGTLIGRWCGFRLVRGPAISDSQCASSRRVRATAPARGPGPGGMGATPSAFQGGLTCGARAPAAVSALLLPCSELFIQDWILAGVALAPGSVLLRTVFLFSVSRGVGLTG